MEYIMISEEKLKITLERQDLEGWDINIDELDYANPAAKSVFDGILGYAKEQFGFDTSGHKLLLQLYPSKDGGCELFVTRLGRLDEEIYNQQEKSNSACRSLCYSFERLPHLIAVCKRLSDVGFDGESSVWYEEDGKWFLILNLATKDAERELRAPDRLAFICEYGEREDMRALPLYLGEYAISIRERDAVEALSRL